MRAKNPTKYTYDKYGKDLLEFVILSDWLFNVPYQEKLETDGIPFWCKKFIQFETREEDHDVLWNIMYYMSLTKKENTIFGEFARFIKGPGVGANTSERAPLGNLHRIGITRKGSNQYYTAANIDE